MNFDSYIGALLRVNSTSDTHPRFIIFLGTDEVPHVPSLQDKWSIKTSWLNCKGSVFWCFHSESTLKEMFKSGTFV